MGALAGMMGGGAAGAAGAGAGAGATAVYQPIPRGGAE